MGRKQASAVPPNLIAGDFCNSLVLRNNAPHTSGSNRSRGTPFFRLLMDVFPLTSACRPLTLHRLSVTFHQATLPINAFYFILLNNYYVVVIPQFFLHCNAFLCFSTIFFMLSFHHPDPAHCTHPYQPKKAKRYESLSSQRQNFVENQRKMQIFSEKLPEFEWFPTFSKSNLNLFAQFFSYMDELYAANHGETLRSGEIRDELKRGHSSSHKKQKRDFFRQLLPRSLSQFWFCSFPFLHAAAA